MKTSESSSLSPSFPRRIRERGFTLLEVMVALTITGMALGGLFGVIAGSKRLAWNSEHALIKSMQVRSLINFSQLNDALGEITVDFENPELRLNTDMDLEMTDPDRKTQASQLTLRGYEINDENGEIVASGSYWVELGLPE